MSDPFEVWSTRLFPKGQGADAYRLTGLAARCDWVVLSDSAEPQTRLRVRPGAPASPRAVFLSLRNAEPAFVYFASQILLRIRTPFVLFSGSEDVTTPRQTDRRWKPYSPPVRAAIDEILSHPLLMTWWAENLDEVGHPKLRPMPLGLLPDGGSPAIAKTLEFETLMRRPLTVLCAHRHREGPQWEPRRQVSALAREVWESWATILEEPVEEPVFNRLLSRHSFVLCVEGGGLDPSPKAWQALLHGAIPIIRKSPTAAAYEDLPVVIIDDWKGSAITLEKLEGWRNWLSGEFQKTADWRTDWFDRLSFRQGWNKRVEPLGDTAHAVRFSARTPMPSGQTGLASGQETVSVPQSTGPNVANSKLCHSDTASCCPNSNAVSSDISTLSGGINLHYSIAHPEIALGESANLSLDGNVRPFDRESLYAFIHGNANANLVIWAAPASHLFAACLSEGMSSDDAQQWVQNRASEVLDLFRRARRQVLILPAEASWFPSEKITETIRAYFDDRAQPVFNIGMDILPQPDPTGVLYRLVSAAAIEGNPALKRLDQELRASMGQVQLDSELLKGEVAAALRGLSGFSRPLSSGGLPAGVDEGPQTALDAQRVLVAEIQDALFVCQEELEWYHRLATRKGGGLEQRRLERKLQAVLEERDLLRSQLSDLKVQLDWAQRDAEQVRFALDETRNSTSWKLTALFRKLKGGAAPEKERKLLEGPTSEKGGK